ncbi:MAG: alpha-glucan family phosphorylase [Candidatus Promineifilaceae bacterium]
MLTPLAEKMPEKIGRLPELAYNLWWSWSPDARALFRRLDAVLWQKGHHNPVLLLQQITAEQLKAAARDALFCRHYDKVLMDFDREMRNGHTWFRTSHPQLKDEVVAYFSAEFGLHNSLPIYSGGLGILSGDHAKEASDIGLALVGVGFMYPQGYFRQRLPSHGWQEAVYEQLNLGQAPVQPALDAKGAEVKVAVQMGERTVHGRVWHVRVGRAALYLLDTDVDDNDPWERELSARLYSGDSDLRIRQEVMLGVGGVRALRALGVHPSVWHMNEGHSAFLVLECIREKVAEGMAFEQAKEEVRARTLFTTHTPVPAGHDSFPFHLVEKHFAGFWEHLGISREQFLDLGKHQEEWGTGFNMTVLALRLSGQANGVSQLHGRVSRRMWRSVWPSAEADEVPLTSITNGVHAPTWIPNELAQVLSRYLGPDWVANHDDPAIWERVQDIPNEELWLVHLELKHKMLSEFRERARRGWSQGSSDASQVLTGGTMLDPDALTIGFARRFATYKRATLIFHDIERLQRILNDVHRPVQLVFAGKAHPADDPGKMLIQNIVHLAKSNQLAGRVAFIEDYDMHLARFLVQGVDVWLNTPRRPREASGTSGQKAAMNGVPNLSVLDGWWAEAYNGLNGWAIGGEQDFPSFEEQDASDAASLYRLLEEEIVPLFYERDRDNIPRGWVAMMRESMLSVAPRFCTRRMLKEYTRLYLRAMQVESVPAEGSAPEPAGVAA